MPRNPPNDEKQHSSEIESGNESESSDCESKNRRSLGSAHKSGELTAYSLWMSIGSLLAFD